MLGRIVKLENGELHIAFRDKVNIAIILFKVIIDAIHGTSLSCT